jgi:signal transduction histidine kinase
VLDLIRFNVLRMIGLVDDLLEIGRLEANRVRLEVAPVEIGAIISDAVTVLRPELERKELALHQEIAEALPRVDADRKRIGQVLINLLSNAVKYTEAHGRIVVRAKVRDEAQLEVQVEDSGVGLTPEQQQQLFVPFYRADNRLRDQVSGTGLGLVIAKALVELHGGTIEIHSAIDVGSTFVFTLPLHQPGPRNAHMKSEVTPLHDT